MKKNLLFVAGLLPVLLTANVALAGQYSDALGQCLVKNANKADT